MIVHDDKLTTYVHGELGVWVGMEALALRRPALQRPRSTATKLPEEAPQRCRTVAGETFSDGLDRVEARPRRAVVVGRPAGNRVLRCDRAADEEGDRRGGTDVEQNLAVRESA